MIKEFKFEKKATATYIRRLQKRGTLSVVRGEHGLLGYDTDEYEEYKASARRGRPPADRDLIDYKVKDILAVKSCKNCPLNKRCNCIQINNYCDIVVLQQELNDVL